MNQNFPLEFEYTLSCKCFHVHELVNTLDTRLSSSFKLFQEAIYSKLLIIANSFYSKCQTKQEIARKIEKLCAFFPSKKASCILNDMLKERAQLILQKPKDFGDACVPSGICNT